MQTIATQIENKVVGKHLVTKRPKGTAFEYVVYKRITSTGFYNSVRSYKGQIYGLIGSEKSKRTYMRPAETIVEQGKAELYYQKGYAAIYKAFPEAKNGLHSKGIITILN
jgi:hypothetical protein